MVDAFSNLGFRLNNTMKCMGPIVIFPNIILSWNVENLRDIDENSLNIFTVKFLMYNIIIFLFIRMLIFQLIDPKPELVVIGYGVRFDTENGTLIQKKGFKQAMMDISKVILAMKKKGISIEALPTGKIISL
jgi:hypothetical protein